MITVLAALVPIFAMIVMGYAMRRYGPYGDGFWLPAERLNYFILFPALLVTNLAAAEIKEIELWPMVLSMVGAILAVGAGCFALRRVLPVDGPGFAALFQGAIRPNAYVAIAAGVALYDDPGLTLVAVAIAVVIPLVNVLSVIVLSTHGAGASLSARDAAAQIARNPIILACVLGIALNLSGLGLPQAAAEFFRLLGRAALPLGLLSVGAGLDIAAAHALGRAVGAASILKLIALPGLTALLCLILGVHGATAAMAVLFNGCPASASSYILTRQMGGDYRMMAGIITVETLAATITLPILMLPSF